MTTRREFLKQALTGTAALSLAGMMPGLSAKSYGQVVGSNSKLNVGMVGVNARGKALANTFAKQPNFQITSICDVDSRAIAKCKADVQKINNSPIKEEKDIRIMLGDKNIDVVVIATPDHWHASGALMAMKAGKDVYLEKPCSYCPEEGEILIKGAAKYGRKLQMGNQRRSWPRVAEAIQLVQGGEIGQVFFGKSWYTSNRGPIGIGKSVPVPEWLDWNLWQGPAPRRPFKDNIVHYNWHWFFHWGTGEALNNGTHMVDLLRWGMEADYPTMVNSAGGRYWHNDDWEWPDTQVINLEFSGKKLMTWEGRSCNNRHIEDSGVGAQFFGEKGSLVIKSGNAYSIFDMKNKLIKEVKSDVTVDANNTLNPSQALDSFHVQNFYRGVTQGEKMVSDIVAGHKSTLLVQLGNIAQRVGRTLNTDPTNGHILQDKDAQKLWSREYEKGWEMTL